MAGSGYTFWKVDGHTHGQESAYPLARIRILEDKRSAVGTLQVQLKGDPQWPVQSIRGLHKLV
jgi:hypothetical protein